MTLYRLTDCFQVDFRLIDPTAEDAIGFKYAETFLKK